MRHGKVYIDGKFVEIETLTIKDKSSLEDLLIEILKTLKSIEKELKQNAREGTVTNAITKETNRIK